MFDASLSTFLVGQAICSVSLLDELRAASERMEGGGVDVRW